MNVKKISIYIVIVIILLCTGFFSGRISAGRGTEKLEQQTVELRSKLEREAENNRQLTAGLKNSEQRIVQLQNSIDCITNRNKKLETQLGNISGELGSDIKKVSDVRKEMEVYIKKVEVLENNSNN